MSKIPINPDVLVWARESAGFLQEDLSREYPRYMEWERGETYPSYKQLEKLAKKFRRPIAIFFFPEPPQEEPIEKSLRAMIPDNIENLPPTVRFLFRKAKVFQIYLRELHAEDISKQTQKISWLHDDANKAMPIPVLAQHIREVLEVSIHEQSGWSDSGDALKKWRDVLAQHGIYVFKDAFKDDRISGFCIYDDEFPIIFINNSLSKNRQIFTIFHELAHLLFKESYLDVFDEAFWRLEHQDPNHIEVKCNAFAGHFLVPDEEFKREFSPDKSIEGNIEELAKHFKVSKEVILRKFLDNGVVTTEFYDDKINEWYQEIRGSEEIRRGGGNYFNTKLAYLGDYYLAMVFQQYYQGKIDMGQAAEYLDIKVKSFDDIEDAFSKKGALSVYL